MGSGIARMRDVGAFTKAFYAFDPVTVTAGGGADGVAQNGVAIDRETVRPILYSGKFVVQAKVDVAAAETATVNVKIQDSADGAAWADYTYKSEAVEEVFDADGSNVIEYSVNLAGARKHVRLVVTVTMSAGVTDTCIVSATFIAAPGELPVLAV